MIDVQLPGTQPAVAAAAETAAEPEVRRPVPRASLPRCGVACVTPGGGPGTLVCTRILQQAGRHEGVHYDKLKHYWFDHVTAPNVITGRTGWEWHFSESELR